jgi:UDP-perosamine 4-acetyltransferase
VDCQGVVLLGAGGHAKVVIEAFRAVGDTVAHCIGGSADPETLLGVPVIHDENELARLRSEGFQRAFVAIGSNKVRDKLGAKLEALGFELVSIIHPRAWFSPSARMGRGAVVMAGSVVNACAVIGDLAIINTGATVDHDCVIGRCVHVAPQCALAGCVSVGERAMLGVGAKVIPGIRIGADATVGAGSVVVRDVNDAALVMGVPARVRDGGRTR